ncbi:hypothetical protein HBH95_097560 [Parastagonospora nodorum]|nr:hypothetical protein HBH95_097560 [Parastagonospora nodorum]
MSHVLFCWESNISSSIVAFSYSPSAHHVIQWTLAHRFHLFSLCQIYNPPQSRPIFFANLVKFTRGRISLPAFSPRGVRFTLSHSSQSSSSDPAKFITLIHSQLLSAQSNYNVKSAGRHALSQVAVLDVVFVSANVSNWPHGH